MEKRDIVKLLKIKNDMKSLIGCMDNIVLSFDISHRIQNSSFLSFFYNKANEIIFQVEEIFRNVK